MAAMVFGFYTLLKMAALSYVAVYMGGFGPRMVFATYALATFLALPLVEETVRALKVAARPGSLPA